jgi:N-acetylmuramoyl-L-alanine amidase
MGLRTAVVLFAVATPALAAAAVLERVEVVGEEPTAVRLHLSEPVAADPRTLPAEGDAPARIYLDLAGTVLGPAIEKTTAGCGSLLRGVRVGQFDPETARVVLDLTRSVPFSVHATHQSITIQLVPPVAARAAPKPAVPRSSEPEPPPSPPQAPSPSQAPSPPLAPSSPQAAEPETPPPLAVAPAPSRSVHPSLPAPAPLRPLVILDPGHGGRDPGTAGVGGVLEKDVVLEVAELLARRLTARLPVDVLLTRTDDSFVPIENRIALPSGGATLFISLHANACNDPSARGLEVFYGGGTLRAASTRGADSRAALLGSCLDQALEARVGGVRGQARPGSFRVLARNSVPSALIEIGYLTHPAEAARARDTDYQALLADALVDGVAAFLRASAPRL